MIEAMKQALKTLEEIHAGNMTPMAEEAWNKAITSLRQAIAEAEKQEPVALPPVQFEKVADGIEIGYDFLGGVDIRLGGEFVYVHINYDYRYTHNAGRKALAEQIVELLTHPQPKREWVGLTGEQICDCWNLNGEQFYKNIETKLKELNT